MVEEKKSLLDKARGVRTQARGAFNVTDDMVDMVHAWARNELTVGQCTAALGYNTSQKTYPYLALVLQHMVMNGLLVADGWLKEK